MGLINNHNTMFLCPALAGVPGVQVCGLGGVGAAEHQASAGGPNQGAD